MRTHIECDLREGQHLGSRTLYIGEIVNVTADESLFDENGKINTDKITPLGYIPQTSTYYQTGPQVEKAGYTQK